MAVTGLREEKGAREEDRRGRVEMGGGACSDGGLTWKKERNHKGQSVDCLPAVTILWHFPCQPDLPEQCKIALDGCDFSAHLSGVYCTYCIFKGCSSKRFSTLLFPPRLDPTGDHLSSLYTDVCLQRQVSAFISGTRARRQKNACDDDVTMEIVLKGNCKIYVVR